MEQSVDDEIDAGGMIEVLDPSGHFEIRWGKKKAEVEAAEEQFNALLKKSYLAFKRTWIGRKGKQALQFDPKAGAYIFEKPSEQKPDDAADGEKTLPALADDKKGERLPALADGEKADEKGADEDEFEYHKTKEFDKKGKHVMVPPLRGG